MKSLIKKLVPKFLIHWYHYLLAFAGAVLYGFPSKKITVIGVTGTKGKSSVVEMCHKIFQEAGFKTASMSTIRFKINDEEKQNTLKMTMPGRFHIQEFLKKAVNAGCKYIILEVTSEGIVQYRHKFISFKAVIFTNLEPEHIERHGGFENYKKAKGKLFAETKNTHIINIDDKNAEYFLQFPAEKKYLYGIKNTKIKQDGNSKMVVAENVQTSENGSSFVVKGAQFSLKLPGEFNVYNALAAISVAISEGVGLDFCKSALENIYEIYGRMNLVGEKPFKVVVDYAHTPDSLEKVYQTFKNKDKKRKLVCVLGSAGGGRDRWKRPKMGEIAARYCDQIILTNEDPYDEDPNKILSEIEKGLFRFSNYQKIIDRRQAINKALSFAKEGGVVLITGKGREPWMCVEKGKKVPWDDKKVAEEELSKLKLGD